MARMAKFVGLAVTIALLAGMLALPAHAQQPRNSRDRGAASKSKVRPKAPPPAEEEPVDEEDSQAEGVYDRNSSDDAGYDDRTEEQPDDERPAPRRANRSRPTRESESSESEEPEREEAADRGDAEDASSETAEDEDDPSVEETPRGKTGRSRKGPAPDDILPPFANRQPSPQERKIVDKALADWELKTEKIETFKVAFTKWEYVQDSGFADPQQPVRKSVGEIKYAAPCKGRYRIKRSTYYSPAENPKAPPVEQQEEGGEYWLCDGEAIIEIRQAEKEVVERRLPPELQGQAIADGPLPFVFGVDAAKLKERFYIHPITPQDAEEGSLWLEFFPRTTADWLEYDHVVVILSEESMLPTAIKITKPNLTTWESFAFDPPKINSFVEKVRDFLSPKTPLGWKRVAIPFKGAPARAEEQAERETPVPKRAERAADKRKTNKG